MLQADIIWAVWRARTAPSTWGADVLSNFSLQNFNAPRRRVVRFAFSLVGTSYIWGGEWPSRTPPGDPYGAQPAGGFDCSGFRWYVLRRKQSNWSPNRPYRGWPLAQRSSADMARAAPRRIPLRNLRPGDIMFFSPNGRRARPRSIYHAGLYLGRGWMIHSSGSRAGISLASVRPGTFWRGQFAWGRRVIPN
jgi:cell wall-associated NlpC family hydrolase